MAFTQWLSTGPISLAIPGLPTIYEGFARVAYIDGQLNIAVSYIASYQGETLQSYSVAGASFDIFGDLEGAAAISAVNNTNPSEVPAIYQGTGGKLFGSTYSNEFIYSWLSTSSNGASTTVYYSIGRETTQGPVFAPAVTAFTGVDLPASLATDQIQAEQIGTANVGLAVETLNGSNVQTLDFLIIDGDGNAASNVSANFTDPNWTAGNVYAWRFAANANSVSTGRLMTEDITQSGMSQSASLHFWSVSAAGAVTSIWTAATQFSAINSIEWAPNSTNTNLLIDLSGTTANGSQHELLFTADSTGDVTNGGTLAQSYVGTPTQVASDVGIGGGVSGWINYWVDGDGLTLQEITVASGVISVASTINIAAANSTASVTSLGDGRIEVDWDVVTGSPSTAGSTATDYVDIYDLRTAGLDGPGTPIEGDIAGTPFNDTITNVSGDFTIDGGGGTDTYSATEFSLAQVSISFNASGAVVLTTPDGVDTLIGFTYIELADATIAISSLSGQSYSGYGEIFSDGTYEGIDYFFTNVTGQAYSSYTYDYSAGNDFIGSQFFYTSVPQGANYAGYEYDYDGGGNVTRVDFTGVTGTGYSSYEYDFVGGVFSGSKFEVTSVALGASYSSYELDYNSAGSFIGDKFFFTTITGQSYSGLEEDFDAGGNLVKVVLSGVTGQSYTSLEEDYSTGTYTGYKATYTGITGQAYTTEEVDVSSANQITKVIYEGLSGTPYSSVEQDYSNGALADVIYNFTNVTGASAYAYQVEETPQGAVLQSTYDNNNGSHTIIGAAANQTFASIANDTITGGGSGETFVFNPAYGHDTITDFSSYLTGATHDTISLATSEFANFAAVLSGAQNVGANVVITAPTGDTLTLNNVSVSALSANQSDFTFHA